jgi:hypothetical protein
MKNIREILVDMSKTDIIAAILLLLEGKYDHYDTDSQVNFISLTDQINMLSYITPRNRKSDPSSTWESPNKTEMRIGRMIRKIIEDTKKSEFVANFKGRAIIQTEKVHQVDRTVLMFSYNITGSGFCDFFTPLTFEMCGDQSGGMDSPKRPLISTKIDIKIFKKSYTSYVYDFSDMVYRMEWDKDNIYFKLYLTDKLEIGYPDNKITKKQSDMIDKSIDFKDYVFDCYIKFTNLFGTYAHSSKRIEDINDSDIEKFVNAFIPEVKMIRADDDSKIEEIKGEDIRKWYDSDNYKSSKIGQLGTSCMSYKECQEYFDIYTENPEVVSLLILKLDEKLIGRALLWRLEEGGRFMDRVYCSTEYDERIFTKYAIENGYYYRSNTNNNKIIYYKNGESIGNPAFSVSVANCDFELYPYIDTFSGLDLEDGVLHNEDGYDRELRDTEGKWTEFYEENDDY